MNRGENRGCAIVLIFIGFCSLALVFGGWHAVGVTLGIACLLLGVSGLYNDLTKESSDDTQ